ncbi:c-type cytochrome [Swingsia samuiensis]|uniref:Cytochrome c n=1 Tax=Swingsia samuiensis TaxID=1293412 RepID=A0A4Y6UH75_9PROT|nr:cytochrome c [Swingsia samuiensis]QDH16374.1 cytochrome c [Swingsia samuiensis]
MKRFLLFLCISLACCGKKSPGQTAYGPNCGICHHGGKGMPGEIPPLVGRLDIIAQSPEGRRYLADVLLNGLHGPFTTQGYTYNYSMPSFRDRLNDQEISEILNWLISRGETKPSPIITPQDIAHARLLSGDPALTYKERQNLNLKHPLP